MRHWAARTKSLSNYGTLSLSRNIAVCRMLLGLPYMCDSAGVAGNGFSLVSGK